MPRTAAPRPNVPAAPGAPAAFDAAAAVLQAFATNERINQYLVAHLDDAAWRAAPPGGKGRTVAAVVAHMHAVRGMWLKAVGAPVPAPLDKETCTRAEAADALAASHAALADVLAAALAGDGRVKGFKPDAVGFFAYLVAHDAHHRGQAAMLARQAGHPLPKAAGFGMWEWGSRGREAGAPAGVGPDA
jgi:uncharacterized damage-inducible protein DinB